MNSKDILAPQLSVDEWNELLRSLSYREREIVKLRFGLGDGYRYTLEEIGSLFHVSRERIRQVEKKALMKIEAWIASRHAKGDC